MNIQDLIDFTLYLQKVDPKFYSLTEEQIKAHAVRFWDMMHGED